jgi:anti-sigma factor RsiW
MTVCSDKDAMLQALLDGELDAANTLAIEAHLATCAACAARWRTLQALRERLSAADLNPPAPARLHRRIEAMIAAESRPKPKAAAAGWRTRIGAGWVAAGAVAGVAASLLAIQLQPTSASLEGQLVDGHVRSLLANHLIDVATSDRHVVKPWFNGKIDFAPPVVDLADQGFPLVGGRLDYADNRVVAALVYRRRAHIINLFVLPATFGSDWRHARPSSYSVVHWRRGSLDYWAVSDVEAGDLKQFQQDFEARAGS